MDLLNSLLFSHVAIQFKHRGSNPVALYHRHCPYGQCDRGGGTLQLTNQNGNALYVDSNGNVGIGTGMPMSKLEVNGGIKLSGQVLNPNKICFFVRKNNGAQNTGPESIPFNDVVINIGSCYKSTDGRFTPTTAGFYFTSWSIGSGNNHLSVTLFKNNGEAIFQSYTDSPYDELSASVIVYMNGSSDFLTLYAAQNYRGDNHTCWSGFLIG